MTLEQIKNTLRTIILSHGLEFDFGEDFLIATNRSYPLGFLELPYNISWEKVNNRFQFENIGFALDILLPPNHVDIDADHDAISSARTLANTIIPEFNAELETQGFTVEVVDALSLRNETTDKVSGMRYEIVIKGVLPRCQC